MKMTPEMQRIYLIGYERGWNAGLIDGSLAILDQQEADAADLRAVVDGWAERKKKPAARVFTEEDRAQMDERLIDIFRKAIPVRDPVTEA